MSLIKQVFAGRDPLDPSAASGESINLAPPAAFGELGKVTITKMIAGIISFLMIIASFIFFVMLVLGGVKWIMSEGDEAKVKTARDQVQNALVGLVVVFSAWAIMQLIEAVFGVDLFGSALKLPEFFTL